MLDEELELDILDDDRLELEEETEELLEEAPEVSEKLSTVSVPAPCKRW